MHKNECKFALIAPIHFPRIDGHQKRKKTVTHHFLNLQVRGSCRNHLDDAPTGSAAGGTSGQGLRSNPKHEHPAGTPGRNH